jgi:hypothetical protein
MYLVCVIQCKNCHYSYEGNYCNQCGERHYTVDDKSIGQLFKDWLYSLTNLEGRFFSTLGAIFFRPGQLALDYGQGIRKRYYNPISLYLLIVVVYLIFPLFSGLNMKMPSYKTMPVFGQFVKAQIDEELALREITEAELTAQFANHSNTTSKVLLFLLIPLSAGVLFLLYPGKKRRMWFDNLVLATEINVVYLLVLYILFSVLYYLLVVFLNLPELGDEQLGFSLTALFGVYAAIIFRRIFKSGWGASLIKGQLFSFLHALLILPVYKAFVFKSTMLLV